VSINGLSVWDEFGKNEVENGFENRIFRMKTRGGKIKKITCQGGTTVRPCGTAVRVFSTLGGTTVPTPLCA